MESLISLQSFTQNLEEKLSIWTSVGPSIAEEKSRIYEARRRQWQKLIFARIILLQVAHHIASNKDARKAIDQEAANAAAVKALEDFEASKSSNDIDQQEEINCYMDRTRQLLAECPQIWARLAAKKAELLSRANDAMNLSNQSSLSQDWQGVSELMQQQRDTILEEVKEIQHNTSQLEIQEAKPYMQGIQDRLATSRNKANEIQSKTVETDRLQRILAEAHGILAPPPEHEDSQEENGSDLYYKHYLAEEVAVMSKYYELSHKKASRIVNCEVIAPEQNSMDESYEIILSPVNDWLRKLSESNQWPFLKNIRIVYAPMSVYPSDISLKVDLSYIPQEKLESVKSKLAKDVGLWKDRMLESPSMDIRKIFAIFYPDIPLDDLKPA